MTAYVVRRLLWMPVVVLAVALVTFALGLYGPGDPVEVLLGPRQNPEAVARLRHEWGLDQPFAIQFVRYVGRVLRADFGESYKFRGQPVAELLAPRMWVSAQLAFVAMVISFAIGVPAGVIAATRQGRWLDTAVVGLTLLGISTPVFVVAPILQWIFTRQLHWLPTAGWEGIFSTKIILPALVLGIPPIAGIARQTRSAVLEVIAQDYVRTARAKGLAERIVLTRHILRNALIPVITLLGFFLADLPSGALIVESIFGIPGVGRLAFESIFARDYPVIMATTLVGAVSFVLANLVVDIAYTFVDPRIRYK